MKDKIIEILKEELYASFGHSDEVFGIEKAASRIEALGGDCDTDHLRTKVAQLLFQIFHREMGDKMISNYLEDIDNLYYPYIHKNEDKMSAGEYLASLNKENEVCGGIPTHSEDEVIYLMEQYAKYRTT